MNQPYSLEDIADDSDVVGLVRDDTAPANTEATAHSPQLSAIRQRLADTKAANIPFRFNCQTVTQERARELLGSAGLPAHIVAGTLGVTASYISQLLADADFAYDVQSLRFKNTQAYSERDKKIEAIEDKLLDKISKSVVFANKLPELTKAFQIMNAAKRRGTTDINDSGLTTGVTVTLTMPKTALDSYQVRLDVNNNVVEAGSQSMHTATLRDVVGLVTQRADTSNKLGYNNVGAEDVTPRFSTTGESKAASERQDFSTDDI